MMLLGDSLHTSLSTWLSPDRLAWDGEGDASIFRGTTGSTAKSWLFCGAATVGHNTSSKKLALLLATSVIQSKENKKRKQNKISK